MTADGFRRIALGLADAVEGAHMGHPDFRVGGKVFATLGYPRDGHAMVKLAPDEQAFFVGSEPATFAPTNGAWGKAGSTIVTLRAAKQAAVRAALVAAHAHRHRS
jgi:hypothetical protein